MKAIIFGSIPKPEGADYSNVKYQLGTTINGDPLAQACNCIGPQPGQIKCPCVLRREAEMGQKMVDEGVTINGRRYRLVEDPQ